MLDSKDWSAVNNRPSGNEPNQLTHQAPAADLIGSRPTANSLNHVAAVPISLQAGQTLPTNQNAAVEHAKLSNAFQSNRLNASNAGPSFGFHPTHLVDSNAPIINASADQHEAANSAELKIFDPNMDDPHEFIDRFEEMTRGLKLKDKFNKFIEQLPNNMRKSVKLELTRAEITWYSFVEKFLANYGQKYQQLVENLENQIFDSSEFIILILPS